MTALQVAAGYPGLKDAVKSSRDWFTGGWFAQSAAQASTWLGGGSAPLKDKLSVG